MTTTFDPQSHDIKEAFERVWNNLQKSYKASASGQEQAKSLNIPETFPVGWISRQPFRTAAPEIQNAAVSLGFMRKLSGEQSVYLATEALVLSSKNTESQPVGFYIWPQDERKSPFSLPHSGGIFPEYPSERTQRIVVCATVQTAVRLNSAYLDAVTMAVTCPDERFRELIQVCHSLPNLKEIVLYFPKEHPQRARLSDTFGLLRLKGILFEAIDESEDLQNVLERLQNLPVSPDELPNRNPRLVSQPDENEYFTLEATIPEAIKFATPDFILTVFGGVSATGLDRLRITLRTEPASGNLLKSYRQNLDLYDPNAIAEYVKNAAPKLEVSTEDLSEAIAALVVALEKYRLKQLKTNITVSIPDGLMNETQHEDALNYLKSENLLEQTQTDIGRSGVVGEENNRLLLFLIFLSRQLENPLHTLLLGKEGSGKKFLLTKVSELIPPENMVPISALSANALFYFERDALKNKLLLVDDMDNVHPNGLAALRELQQKGVLHKPIPVKNAAGKLKINQFEVVGPVCVAASTSRGNASQKEFALCLQLEASKEQNEKVLAYQRAVAAGKISAADEAKIRERFWNFQRLLQPVSVRNPYAESLTLPNTVVNPRRSNEQYLRLIETIAFYHQFSRERNIDEATGEIFIEVEPADIEWAHRLLKGVFVTQSDELNDPARRLLEQIKSYLLKEKIDSFKAAEIRAAFRLNPGNLKRWLKNLIAYGYLKVESGSQRQGFVYRLSDPEEYAVLTKNVETTLAAFGENLNDGAMARNSSVVECTI